jgi:hypothetical protein
VPSFITTAKFRARQELVVDEVAAN